MFLRQKSLAGVGEEADRFKARVVHVKKKD